MHGRNPDRWMIINANIVMETTVFRLGNLVCNGGTIEFIGSTEHLSLELRETLALRGTAVASDHSPQAEFQNEDVQVIDAQGGWLLPGFIDVHVHGGNGGDFMDADSKAFDTITQFHCSHGTTAMLATSVTAPKAEIERLLEAVTQYRSGNMPFAELLGVHLEGPFISPVFAGAQNPRFIVLPQQQWVEAWVSAYPGIIKMITLAPEMEGALELVKWLSAHHIIPSCGHTDATYEEIEQAVAKGLRHAVHIFNAMKGLHHREPGTVGAVLTDDRLSAEIIADGHHVHPAVIKLLTQMKQQNNLLLITDAISATGLGGGLHDLGGMAVNVTGSIATLKDGKTLAGSTLTMLNALGFMIKEVGLDIVQASQMASGNPAKLLGIDHYTGSLQEGKRADVLLLYPELQIKRVWIKGKSVRINPLV